MTELRNLLQECDRITLFVKHNGAGAHKIYAEVVPIEKPLFIVSAETTDNLISNIAYQLENMFQ